MGMMVCADGRIPEIARILALKGARVIFDVVNLVTNARTPAEMDNQQHQFMLKARARENGVHIVVCNKCGVEANITTYMGRSFVVDPQGEILAECSPDRPQALSVAFEPEDAPRAARMEMRRPERYAAIVTQGVAPPCGRPGLCDDGALYGVFRSGVCAKGGVLSARRRRCAGNFSAAARIHMERGGTARRASGAQSRHASGTDSGFRRVNGAGRQAVLLYDQGAEFRLRDAHMPEGEASPVARLPQGMTVAALFDEEIEVPEIARCAMLQGANLLLYFDGIRAPHTMDSFARERRKTRFMFSPVMTRAAMGHMCASIPTAPSPPQRCWAANMPRASRFGRNSLPIRMWFLAPILEHRMPKYYEEIVKHERLSD